MAISSIFCRQSLAPNTHPLQNDSNIVRAELVDIATRFVGADGRGPFAALADLVAVGCHVVVLLGNHDLELCLPGVRETFVKLIGGSSKVRFIYDGEAYTCGRLLVEHGNQYDRFNAVDYDQLRRERSQLSRGMTIQDSERGTVYFQPPVGSSMVVDEVNPRLAAAPFFNLLKPEFGAAIPLMLAFYPESRKFYELIFKFGKIARRVRQNTLAKQPGLLSGAGPVAHTDLNSFLREELGTDASAFLGPAVLPGQLSGSPSGTSSLMARLARQATLAIDLTCPWGLYNRLRTGDDEERLKCVRVALRQVRDATDFAIDTERSEYLAPAEKFIDEGGFEAVVFGHTHFPKELEVANGKYLNAGTWADVLRLPSDVASGDDLLADNAIERFLKDMSEHNYEPYTVRHRSFVRAVVETDGAVDAALHFYSGE
jgi:UDP-2,3-diacylglucosamine pyrophosphatase LpxH